MLNYICYLDFKVINLSTFNDDFNFHDFIRINHFFQFIKKKAALS